MKKTTANSLLEGMKDYYEQPNRTRAATINRITKREMYQDEVKDFASFLKDHGKPANSFVFDSRLKK